MTIKKISLLVASYDGNLDLLSLWDQWHSEKVANIPLYYGLNSASFQPINRSAVVLNSSKASWGESLAIWCRQIDSEYILLVLDDIFIKKLDLPTLFACCDYMTSRSAYYGYLHNYLSLTYMLSVADLFCVDMATRRHSKYQVSLQASIWKTDVLMQHGLLYDDPWDLESRAHSHPYLDTLDTPNRLSFKSHKISFYEQFCERGLIFRHRTRFIVEKIYRQLLMKRKPVSFIRTLAVIFLFQPRTFLRMLMYP